jgi:hypothetical protein
MKARLTIATITALTTFLAFAGTALAGTSTTPL